MIILLIMGYLGHGFGAWLLVVCLLYPKLDIDTRDWFGDGCGLMHCLPMWLLLWPLGLCNTILVVIKILGDYLYNYIQRRR